MDERAAMAKSNSSAAGRQRRERWRELLGRWRASGLTQAAFCRQEQIHVWQFAWWKKRLGADRVIGQGRRTRQSRGIASVEIAASAMAGQHDPQFVPVQVVASPPTGDLELTLRGGRVLRFGADVDASKLAEGRQTTARPHLLKKSKQNMCAIYSQGGRSRPNSAI